MIDEQAGATLVKPEEQFVHVYENHHPRLVRYLRRAFAHFESDVADLAQETFIRTLKELRKPGFTAPESWWPWLRKVGFHVGIDRARRHEMMALEALTASNPDSGWPGWQPEDARPSPSEQVIENQRRQRQVQMFSDILREWCRDRERSPGGLKQKECLERLLRGQTYEEVGAALCTDRNTLYQWRNRATEWIKDRARQADVHRSVFLSLLGPDRQQAGAGHASHQTELGSRAPPQARANTGALPELRRFADVVLWAIREGGAMCPSAERLEAYLRCPAAPAFSDIVYHVREGGCRLCDADLAERPSACL